MSFLPKDYVGVSTRIEQAHEKHKEALSIETEFDIRDKTVMFTARVTIINTGQIFTGHSFGEVGREKAFEKLETVAVGRALAFAGFETTGGIASREKMEIFESKDISGKMDNGFANEFDAQEVFEEKDYGTCAKCGAKNKWSEKAGKAYCGAKCWLNS